jgi:mRNA-degrading endonuclease toxin of MazEF toxin-antitoxin module
MAGIRGEVYSAVLHKPRPVVILSVDALSRFALGVCVVPFTTVQHGKFSMRAPIKAGDGGFERNCWVKCDQLRTLAKNVS